jgi:O-methyltransferase involved in polyketide biosynthesis
MKLTDVSKTAFLTLRSHVIESQKKNPIIYDSMAGYCLEKLISLASEEDKNLLLNRRLPSKLTRHIAIRARKYDLMVNLGCGFDTRYWRINNKECKYFDLDLPELIAYDFGINKGNELESYGNGIKVIDEWSYFEDPDSRLKVLKYL